MEEILLAVFEGCESVPDFILTIAEKLCSDDTDDGTQGQITSEMLFERVVGRRVVFN